MLGTQGLQALAVSKEQTAIGRSEKSYPHRVVAVPVTVEESSASHRPNCSRNDAVSAAPAASTEFWA